MERDLADRDEIPPAGPRPVEKAKLLVVEGQDERRLLAVVLKRLGRDDVQIIPCQGKDHMPSVLENLRIRAGFSMVHSVGVIRDAETSARSAFQSVRDAILRGGLQPAPAPGAFSPGPPRIGILIVPPGKERGMLEDLCLESISGDPALPCVDEFFRCLAARAGRIPRSDPRSRVHAWLASQEDPCARLGEAAEKGCWPLDGPAFGPMHEFLKAL
jgi:hypothetical protein